MQITIVVDDKLVLVDRKPLHLPDLDWAVFDLDPANPDDDVQAVQFDTHTGTGHVEFKTRITKQANRPNNRPPDWLIGQAEFDQYFAFVVPAYEDRRAQIEAEAAEAENRAAARKQEIASSPAPVMQVIPEGLITRDEAEALARKAAQEAISAFAASVINPTGG